MTVRDLQRARERKARVNHETYKQLWRLVQDRLRARAENRGRDLLWQVPPWVPGRPVYKPSHAARYVRDKLRLAGFQVRVAAPTEDVQVLHITWDPVAPRPSPHKPSAAATPADAPRRRPGRRSSASASAPDAAKVDVTEAARRVENLKARLRVG